MTDTAQQGLANLFDVLNEGRDRKGQRGIWDTGRYDALMRDVFAKWDAFALAYEQEFLGLEEYSATVKVDGADTVVSGESYDAARRDARGRIGRKDGEAKGKKFADRQFGQKDFDGPNEAQLQEWYDSEKGQTSLKRFAEELVAFLDSHGATGTPGHDRRHVAYMDSAVSFMLKDKTGVADWRTASILGGLLHDTGRIVEEVLTGTSLCGLAGTDHAYLSAEFADQLMQKLEREEGCEFSPFFRESLLYSVVSHTGGEAKKSAMAQYVQAGDRLGGLTVEHYRRAIQANVGEMGLGFRMPLEPEKIWSLAFPGGPRDNNLFGHVFFYASNLFDNLGDEDHSIGLPLRARSLATLWLSMSDEQRFQTFAPWLQRYNPEQFEELKDKYEAAMRASGTVPADWAIPDAGEPSSPGCMKKGLLFKYSDKIPGDKERAERLDAQLWSEMQEQIAAFSPPQDVPQDFVKLRYYAWAQLEKQITAPGCNITAHGMRTILAEFKKLNAAELRNLVTGFAYYDGVQHDFDTVCKMVLAKHTNDEGFTGVIARYADKVASSGSTPMIQFTPRKAKPAAVVPVAPPAESARRQGNDMNYRASLIAVALAGGIGLLAWIFTSQMPPSAPAPARTPAADNGSPDRAPSVPADNRTYTEGAVGAVGDFRIEFSQMTLDGRRVGDVARVLFIDNEPQPGDFICTLPPTDARCEAIAEVSDVYAGMAKAPEADRRAAADRRLAAWSARNRQALVNGQ
ncbi:MAG: hypothetical protein AB7G06_03375 [Bdellovibrionales bacterium]